MRRSHITLVKLDSVKELIDQNELSAEMISECLEENIQAARAHLDVTRTTLSLMDEICFERRICQTSILLGLIRQRYFHGEV